MVANVEKPNSLIISVLNLIRSSICFGLTEHENIELANLFQIQLKFILLQVSNYLI
jgi:hypothetical protein